MNKSNKQIDTFSQLRLPLIVLITFAHSYSGVRAGWTLWDGGWDSYEIVKLVVSETLVKVAMPTFFVMSESVDVGRASVLDAIRDLQKVNSQKSNIYIVQIFVQAKADEIVNIFKEATPVEKTEVVRLMKQLDPSNSAKYNAINQAN